MPKFKVGELELLQLHAPHIPKIYLYEQKSHYYLHIIGNLYECDYGEMIPVLQNSLLTLFRR